MSERIFDKDVILDLTVNMIPLGIIAFFVGVFLLQNPFGGERIFMWIQYAIMTGMFVLLAILTYVSGKKIAVDEKRREHVDDA